MNILAIEASSAQCSVAVSVKDQVFSRSTEIPRQQAQRILPMIDAVLSEAASHLENLDAIALGIGPGSFTGLRLAMGVVQGLSYATELPIIPISSLAVIAQGAYLQHDCSEVLVVVDAHMGELYQGHYQLREGFMQAVSQDVLIKPDKVMLHDTIFLADKVLPTAEALLSLAEHTADQQQPIFKIMPNYLRGKQAWKTLENQ